MALFVSVLLCACAGALAFNVDIPSRVVYRGSNSSMFGFTVQSHISGDKKMILVGAPEDDPYPPVQGVTRPGAVYRCTPRFGSRSQERCDLMVFDANGRNNIDGSSRQIDQKSNQWFGATLSSSGRDGPIVACAPRYVSFVTAKMNQRDPVGSCFVASNADLQDVHEVSPCRTCKYNPRPSEVNQRSSRLQFPSNADFKNVHEVSPCRTCKYSPRPSEVTQRDPVGFCFVASNADLQDVHEVSPCRTCKYSPRPSEVNQRS